MWCDKAIVDTLRNDIYIKFKLKDGVWKIDLFTRTGMVENEFGDKRTLKDDMSVHCSER